MKSKIIIFACGQLILLSMILFCLYGLYSQPGLFPYWLEWLLITLAMISIFYSFWIFLADTSGTARLSFLCCLFFAALFGAGGLLLQNTVKNISDAAENANDIHPLKAASGIQQTTRSNGQIVYPFSVFVSGTETSGSEPCFVVNVNPQTHQILILRIRSGALQSDPAETIRRQLESDLNFSIRDTVQIRYDALNAFLDSYGPYALDFSKAETAAQMYADLNFPFEPDALNADQILQILKVSGSVPEDGELFKTVLNSIWQKISQPKNLFEITQILDTLPEMVSGDMPRPVLTQLISQQLSQNPEWEIQCADTPDPENAEQLQAVKNQLTSLLQTRP